MNRWGTIPKHKRLRSKKGHTTYQPTYRKEVRSRESTGIFSLQVNSQVCISRFFMGLVRSLARNVFDFTSLRFMEVMSVRGNLPPKFIAALSCQVSWATFRKTMATGAIGSGRHGWESDIASLRRIYVLSRGGMPHANCKTGPSTIFPYSTLPSQMELVQILGRRFYSVVHLLGMWSVAYACRSFPYSLSPNDFGDITGPFTGGEAGFGRFLQLVLATGADGERAAYLGNMASMNHLPLSLIRRKQVNRLVFILRLHMLDCITDSLVVG